MRNISDLRWRVAVLLWIFFASPAQAATDSVPASCPGGSPPVTGRLCSDPCKAERALEKVRPHIVPLDNHIAIPVDGQNAVVRFLINEEYRGWCHDKAPSTGNIRATGPLVAGPDGGLSFGTHARARVYYSRAVVDWLEGGREGDIADGAMIVKEMWGYPATVGADDVDPTTGWAFMLRDKAASPLGWVWGLYFVPGNKTFQTEYLLMQPGLSFCASCHASADNDQGTFAFLGNLDNDQPATYVQSTPPVIKTDRTFMQLQPPSIGSLDGHQAFGRYMEETVLAMFTPHAPLTAPLAEPSTAVLNMLRRHVSLPKLPSAASVLPLPPNFPYDHKLQKGQGELATFLGSTACVACHNATNLLNNVPPSGQLKVGLKDNEYAKLGIDSINVTPYGEWQGSMMAMSGRDPIFRAQAEWEAAAFSDTAQAQRVTRLCLSCHSVMGERTDPELATSLEATYAFPNLADSTHTDADRRKFEYAALARDGVSCTVCHHMAEEGLGTPATFTARFETGPADELYGPFTDVKTLPMQRALKVTPTHASQIQSAELCGSCHTIDLPVFDKNKQVNTSYEQTTYLEWLNSDYAKTPKPSKKRSPDQDGPQTCQYCHMPRTDPSAPGKNLALKIANVEDSSFPYVPNRANSDQLDPTVRSDYRRHTLVAANVFGIGFFQQFPLLLGSNLFWPGQAPSVLQSKAFSMNETIDQARHESAEVDVVSVKTSADSHTVMVRVNNLAGHKLPSGVGFRRAFLEVSLRDAFGRILWCSGCTDDAGVIVDSEQNALVSEFTKDPELAQADHTYIDSQAQVQIYEHRTTDCHSRLTTSFVRRCNEVKDNRLLPLGWSPNGPYAEVTQPVGLTAKATPGTDRVTYLVPNLQGATSVRATLNYQSIPPYYLVDRFKLLEREGHWPETERLLHMVLHLNTQGGTSMRQWKTPMGCSQRSLTEGATEAQNCIESIAR